jgi:hypothetical protein
MSSPGQKIGFQVKFLKNPGQPTGPTLYGEGMDDTE